MFREENGCFSRRSRTKPKEAQGNMLFLCRSGVFGPRKFLYSVKVILSVPLSTVREARILLQCIDSPDCDCGLNDPETADHLFLRCRHLRVQRAALCEAVKGDMSMSSLFATHAAISADWAICFFGLPQLQFARNHFERRFKALIALGHSGITRE